MYFFPRLKNIKSEATSLVRIGLVHRLTWFTLISLLSPSAFLRVELLSSLLYAVSRNRQASRSQLPWSILHLSSYNKLLLSSHFSVLVLALDALQLLHLVPI